MTTESFLSGISPYLHAFNAVSLLSWMVIFWVLLSKHYKLKESRKKEIEYATKNHSDADVREVIGSLHSLFRQELDGNAFDEAERLLLLYINMAKTQKN